MCLYENAYGICLDFRSPRKGELGDNATRSTGQDAEPIRICFPELPAKTSAASRDLSSVASAKEEVPDFRLNHTRNPAPESRIRPAGPMVLARSGYDGRLRAIHPYSAPIAGVPHAAGRPRRDALRDHGPQTGNPNASFGLESQYYF